MKKIPKGRGRKSDAETYRDAMEILKLIDHDCLTEEEVVEKLGLSRSTVYRLLSRARSAVLAPQNKANREAAEPLTKKWFELPSPEPITTAPLPQEESVIAALATPVVIPPVEPASVEPEPWPWEHLMPFAEFQKRDPHRQKQLIKQWEENTALGGTRWTPVLRGRPYHHGGVCFGTCPPFNCTCHDEKAFDL